MFDRLKSDSGPNRYLASDHGGVVPMMVPTQHSELLASAYGLLFNDLYYSPDSVIRSVVSLLESSLALDTGSVCDIGADDFSISVDIILYIIRYKPTVHLNANSAQ